MTDNADSDRVSWRALRRGADVITADGPRVGAVQHVLADSGADIFAGVVIDVRLGPGGLRFVDPAQISLILEHRLVLTVSKARVREHPAPTSNPGVLEHHANDPMPSAARRRIRGARPAHHRPLREREEPVR